MKSTVSAHRHSRLRAKTLALAVSACLAGPGLANPVGPTVQAGSATFAANGGSLTVTNTPGTIIDWQRFGIGAGELTRFIQQGPASSVLNRVTGADPSQILGTLQSNGRVFLINPNGITFGAGSRVDVAGLVASTLNLSNADFLAGRHDFGARAGAGAIRNHGEIRAADGGQILLVAPSIENSGLISAPNGDVLLAAGKSVRLVDVNNPEIQVELTAADNQAINLGTLAARNVGLFGGAIRHAGTISANTAQVDEQGRVVFRAVGDTLVEAGSRTEATNTAGKGGRVEVLGDRVAVLGDATIDVSGESGGGTVLVGGDYQGANSAVQNARMTYFGADASIRADARGKGDGGQVIVWADDTARAYGSISARGGEAGGDGGFVETSGREHLSAIGTRVDTRAPLGKTGKWLLDPHNMRVKNTGTAVSTAYFEPTTDDEDVDAVTISNQLASTDVELNTGTAGSQPGNITVQADISWTSGKTLKMTAGGNIDLQARLDGRAPSGAGGRINLQAGQDITVNSGAQIWSYSQSSGTGGNITLQAGRNLNVNTSIGQNSDIDARGSATGGVTAGTISLTATSGSVNFDAASFGGSVANSPVTVSAGQDVIIKTDSFSPGGSISATSGKIQILPRTVSTSMQVGGASPGVGTLYVADLADLSAPNVLLGDTTNTAVMTIAAVPNLPTFTNTLAFKGDRGVTVTGPLPVIPDNRHLLLETSATQAVTTNANLTVGTTAANTGSLTLRGGRVLLGTATIQSTGNGSVTLDATGSSGTDDVSQSAAGTVVSHTLTANAAGGSVSLNSSTNNVGTVGGAITSSGNFSLTNGVGDLGISSIATNNGSVTLNSAGGGLKVGTITAGTGTVTLTSKNQMLDENGTANNITGGVLNLTSTDGSATTGALAMSMDTRVSSLSASVNVGAANGGIVLRNTGGALTLNGLTNNASNASAISITNDASITVPVTKTVTNADSGGVTLNASSGNINVTGGTIQGNAGSVKLTAQSGAIQMTGSVGYSARVQTTGLATLESGGDTILTGTGGSAAFVEATNVNLKIGGTLKFSGPDDAYMQVANAGTFNVNFTNCQSNCLSFIGGATTPAAPFLGVVTTTPAHKWGLLYAPTPTPAQQGDHATVSYYTPPAPAPAPAPAPPPPTIEECIANPALAGCSAVLPSLNACIAAPATLGCSVVLPSLATCTAAPATPGCSVVLPSLATCTALPATPGCSVVLPSLATCTAAPATPGCSAVLPSLTTCTAVPATPGCSAVLPSLATCTAAPATAGCSAVLPSLATCTAAPATPGCTAVLPSMAVCLAAPATPGCSAVLPTLATCQDNPGQEGCQQQQDVGTLAVRDTARLQGDPGGFAGTSDGGGQGEDGNGGSGGLALSEIRSVNQLPVCQ
jgi:filamentous hemagglutinin family protein